MARETRVQSQVESYQRLKIWYLMPPCLTLSIIIYGSRVSGASGVVAIEKEPSGHPRLKGDNFTLLTYLKPSQPLFFRIVWDRFIYFLSILYLLNLPLISRTNIDFNAVSTSQVSFYVNRLGNHEHCMIIFTFLYAYLRVYGGIWEFVFLLQLK